MGQKNTRFGYCGNLLFKKKKKAGPNNISKLNMPEKSLQNLSFTDKHLVRIRFPLVLLQPHLPDIGQGQRQQHLEAYDSSLLSAQ